MLADGGPVRAPQRSIFTPTAVSSRGDVASRPVVEQTSNKFFLKHQHSSKTSYQVDYLKMLLGLITLTLQGDQGNVCYKLDHFTIVFTITNMPHHVLIYDP